MKPALLEKGLLGLLITGAVITASWAETLKLVTHYNPQAQSDDLRVKTLTAGGDSAYQNQTPTDGIMVLSNQIAIGTITPQADLHVNGGFYRLGGNGDADGDKELTAKDAEAIRAYLARTGTLTPQPYAQADVNGDGRVNMLDADLIDEVVATVSGVTLADAHHAVGKGISDQAIGLSLNGNIGIGTVDPQVRLHVVGENDAVSSVIFMPGVNTQAPGTPEMRLGIGTRAPHAMLEVAGGSYFLGGNGDVDGDGILSDKDIPMVSNYLEKNGSLTVDQYARADVNGDGRVDNADLLLLNAIWKKLSGGGGGYTLAQAHHSVGKAVWDRTVSYDLRGNVGVGIRALNNTLSPGNDIDRGNLEANDIFLRSVKKWAAEASSNSSLKVYALPESSNKPVELKKPVVLVGEEQIRSRFNGVRRGTIVTWADTPFSQIPVVAFFTPIEEPFSGENHPSNSSSVFFRVSLAGPELQRCYFIVIGEGD